jgi:hypothetical protein
MIKTPLDIIKFSLKMANVIGVGQTASSEDANDCFDMLNMMLAQWRKRRLLVYHLTEYVKQATGAQYYTIGTGGDFNYTRPARIECAYFRQTSLANLTVDYPLEIINSREDYNRILIKNLNSWPQALFYDSDYPLGKIYIWPVPSNLYEIHITVMDQLQKFNNLNDVIALPEEYIEAIVSNLTLRIYAMYGLPANEIVVQQAKVSLNILKSINTQIPLLQMPQALIGGRSYNIFGDIR